MVTLLTPYIYICCGSILSLVQILFSFVSNYNTQKQKKIKFEPRIKLNHNTYIVHIETVTHSSYKDFFFSWIFRDFVLSNSVNLLIFLTDNFSIVSYSNALKCYSRARDYCTTAKHVVNMCVNVIKVGSNWLTWWVFTVLLSHNNLFVSVYLALFTMRSL